MSDFNDVMVDMETTGECPETCAIFQLAAVRFDYATMQIGPSFCVSMWIPDDLHWTTGGRDFWRKHQAVFDSIMATAQDPALMFRAFADWANMTGSIAGPQRLWAKPVSFEMPFLQAYSRRYGVELPFHYRHAVDLHSFTRWLRRDPAAEPIDKQITFDGAMHNAIDDVLHQIKIALSAKILFGQPAQAVAA